MDDDSDKQGGENDNLPKDDASIEVISEGGDSLVRDLEWSIYSAGRSSVAGSDVDLMDFQKLSMHSKMARIVHHDGRQFIERRDLNDGGLPYSAELYLDDEVWKLNGEDCLLMSHRRYIAEVKVEGKINFDSTINFEEAAKILLKHVKVVKVFRDELLQECDKAKHVLQLILDKLVGGPWQTNEHKRDIILMRILIQKHGNSLTSSFKHDLSNFPNLSNETMVALDNYVTKALKLMQRNETLYNFSDPSISDEFINSAIQKALKRHRVELAAICPLNLSDELKKVPDDRILHVSTDDIKLFADLTTLDQPLLHSALPMMFSKFLTKTLGLNNEKLLDQSTLSSPIYVYLCKSLRDIANLVGRYAGNAGALVYSDHGWKTGVLAYSKDDGWNVPIRPNESQTPNGKYFRQQLQMIAKLANHFEPGGPFRTSCFPYEFNVFQNIDAIPEAVRVWLCLLDDTMKDLVHAGSNKMQILSCFFESFVSLTASEEINGETLECLRRTTHGTLWRSRPDTQMPYEQPQKMDIRLRLFYIFLILLGIWFYVHYWLLIQNS